MSDNINFPREAHANEPIEIALAGETFPFREPVKMRADALLANLRSCMSDMADGLMALGAAMEGHEGATPEEAQALIMGNPKSRRAALELESLAPDLWPHVARALGISNKRALAMEATVSAAEVVGAAFLIIQRLTRPFGGGSQNSETAQQDEELPVEEAS